jgi:hypothetical protein
MYARVYLPINAAIVGDASVSHGVSRHLSRQVGFESRSKSQLRRGVSKAWN